MLRVTTVYALVTAPPGTTLISMDVVLGTVATGVDNGHPEPVPRVRNWLLRGAEPGMPRPTSISRATQRRLTADCARAGLFLDFLAIHAARDAANLLDERYADDGGPTDRHLVDEARALAERARHAAEQDSS